MEIERKWLIEGFPAGLPLVAQAAMRQGYIATAPAVRIRESTNETGTQYILCFKGKGTLAREEIETPIDKALFQRLEAFIGKPLVTKAFRAYALPGGETLEVSLVDEGLPTQFFYAEVEFPTVEAARSLHPAAGHWPWPGNDGGRGLFHEPLLAQNAPGGIGRAHRAAV